ncbi:hypothetical protein Vafri_14947 [Volvox africanus]|uniref:Uncharacterized protein n=1 Tax=Volvox africanus TaxID=51714 RepID=A0A8J4BK13_9CHLO|nr:hypothetical protein Vafri_14947 [Volvox africanus]
MVLLRLLPPPSSPLPIPLLSARPLLRLGGTVAAPFPRASRDSKPPPPLLLPAPVWSITTGRDGGGTVCIDPSVAASAAALTSGSSLRLLPPVAPYLALAATSRRLSSFEADAGTPCSSAAAPGMLVVLLRRTTAATPEVSRASRPLSRVLSTTALPRCLRPNAAAAAGGALGPGALISKSPSALVSSAWPVLLLPLALPLLVSARIKRRCVSMYLMRLGP